MSCGPQTKTNETTCCFDDLCCEPWSGSTDPYPYNPDGNADSLIGVADLQDLLTTYGQGFVPNEILFEGQSSFQCAGRFAGTT